MTSSTDRIEKTILLRASRQRVWDAISDAAAFGTWFGVAFDGKFVAGETLIGRVVPTKVDADVARAQQAHAGMTFECDIERLEPMTTLSLRWHPGIPQPGEEYADEHKTTVTFELQDADGGILLTITETGFDRIPLARRAATFASNDEGWAAQVKLIEKYLAMNS